MKIAVFSDVHGNLVALQTLLDHLAAGGFDAVTAWVTCLRRIPTQLRR